jgi:hypothetical protein
VDAIVAGDTTNGAGRPLLEREILDPAAPILKVGGLGDQFQVSDAAPDVYSELVGIHHPRESLPSAREHPLRERRSSEPTHDPKFGADG